MLPFREFTEASLNTFSDVIRVVLFYGLKTKPNLRSSLGKQTGFMSRERREAAAPALMSVVWTKCAQGW